MISTLDEDKQNRLYIIKQMHMYCYILLQLLKKNICLTSLKNNNNKMFVSSHQTTQFQMVTFAS